MNILYLVFIILTGLCVGSFINVLIYRLPLEKSIVSPGSSCTNCGSRIKAYDLIPVISYILLLGRCRNCKEKISIRYPLIELLIGALFAILYLYFGLTIRLVIYCLFAAVLVAILFIDLEHMIIPDSLNVVIALLGISLNIIYPVIDYKTTLLNMLFGVLLGGGFFLILGFFGAMGGGDIKMMAALGLFFGWKVLMPLMFLSFILGGIIGITLLALKIKSMKDMIPFGPYIAISGIIMLFYGNGIVTWYALQLFG